MPARAVLWFRNDLRLRDNQLFHYGEVRAAVKLIAVYCIDPRHYEKSKFGNHPRTHIHRAGFLAESLEDLHRSLGSIGSRLFVVVGQPEDVMPGLLEAEDLLIFQREDTYEEQLVEEALLRRLPLDVVVKSHSGQTLYNREDLGWDPRETLPIPFGKFKFGVCDKIRPRSELLTPRPGDLAPPPTDLASPHPLVHASAADLLAAMEHCAGAKLAPPAELAQPGPSEPKEWQQQPAIQWRGGEKAGLARLEEYCVPGGLGTYHRTRNQLEGANHASHLSPWIANGCVSPRTVFWRAQVYHRDYGGKEGHFDHVYKFVFELCWRDYFRFYCVRFGSKVFHLKGPSGRLRMWRRDSEAEVCWKAGQTGVPLVDALMRELLATGHIANRGRYTVASYLVHYLGIDWRVGADWFESVLLDYDVCSNYGEWTSMAGIAAAPSRGQPLGLKGRGPTEVGSRGSRGAAGNPWSKGTDTGDAVFDPWEQAVQYDRQETYVRRWVPELRHVPGGSAHWPHSLDAATRSEYPAPLATKPFQYSEPSMPARATAVAEQPSSLKKTGPAVTPLTTQRRWKARSGPQS